MRKPTNIFICFNQKFCCLSLYQTQGAYAHLDQRPEKDLDKAVTAATASIFYNDPLHLAIPYNFFLECLPEPPDGFLKSVLSFRLILFVYLNPILRGLISLWLRHIGAYTFSKLFVNKERHRHKQHKHLHKLHIKVFAANASSGNSAFSWDTDSIPFVIDKSAKAIIYKERTLFTGLLTPMSITLATAEGLNTTTKLVGSLRLVITNSSNEHYTYSIPGFVNDPESPLNILGVPALGAYFYDGTDIRNPLEEDVTTAKYGSTTSHFFW